VRTLVVTLSLALLACGNKSSDKPAVGSGSALGSGAGSAPPGDRIVSSEDGPAVPITLPKADGTPPKKTTAKLVDTDFDRLGKLEVPSFTKKVRNQKDGLDVRFTTTRPRLGTTVTITPCFNCAPMDLAKWKEKEDDLKQLLGPDLRDRPDTTWEIGTVDLHGQVVIYTYQVGTLFGKDDQGNPKSSYSDAYALYYNDGVNQIRVITEYMDMPVPRDQMLTIAPKEDLAKVAVAFLDYYAHQW
jgi:hypothetical protein